MPLEEVSSTILDMFIDLGFDPNNMVINRAYPAPCGVEILSYKQDGTFDFCQVLHVVRKPDAKMYQVSSQSGSFMATEAHKLLCVKGATQEYVEIGSFVRGIRDVSEYMVVSLDGCVPFTINEDVCDKPRIVLDIEVAGTNNYVSAGMVSHNTVYGNPETTTGGNALKFYASVRLEVRRSSPNKSAGEAVSSPTKVIVKKNKVAPPFKEAEFDVEYGKGISFAGEVIDLGTEFGIVDKRGAYYRYGETLLGQGRENAKSFLLNGDNAVLSAEIINKVRQAAMGG